MKTTVSLNKVRFDAFHGFYEEERKTGNTFIVNVKVELKSFDSFDDNIHDTVNYEDLYRICEEEMKKTKKLIESVAFAIISRIKEELPNVTAGSVSLYKQNPPMPGDIESAQVKMEF